MIYVEANETSSTSRLPTVAGAVTSTILEHLTGADLMVTPLRMPLTETLLQRHIAAGALLIQRKSGMDLVQSIGYRLHKALATMRATGARQHQCMLLVTGFVLPNTVDETAIVAVPEFGNGGTIRFRSEGFSGMKYMSVQGALRSWLLMGGVTVQLSCDDEIPSWLQGMDDMLGKKKHEGAVKEVWPEAPATFFEEAPSDPLQRPVAVHDWRAKLVVLVDGVGPQLATNLREHLTARGLPDELMAAVSFAMTEDVLGVPGWGRARMLAVREAFYGPDGAVDKP
jgi:hypothetical protein